MGTLRLFKITTSALLLFAAVNLQAQVQKTLLTKGWQFNQQGTAKWYPAQVPGTVHTDLLNNKLIPDPYYRDNEIKLQWIDKLDWNYKTSFNVNASVLSKKNVELVFDGLDTYADVYLNGQLILSANNMFRQWKVDVKHLLKPTNQFILHLQKIKLIQWQKLNCHW